MNVAKKKYKVVNITMLCPYYCCTSILGINIVQCHDDCTSTNWLLVAAKQFIKLIQLRQNISVLLTSINK